MMERPAVIQERVDAAGRAAKAVASLTHAELRDLPHSVELLAELQRAAEALPLQQIRKLLMAEYMAASEEIA